MIQVFSLSGFTNDTNIVSMALQMIQEMCLALQMIQELSQSGFYK